MKIEKLLTRRLRHFLENLWRTDCLQFLIVLPATENLNIFNN